MDERRDQRHRPRQAEADLDGDRQPGHVDDARHPAGFWGAELAHAWYAFTEVGYDVTVASPDGGRCELDAWSDPRDESKYSFGDLVTMGFMNTPESLQLVENTPAVGDLDYGDYDALE